MAIEESLLKTNFVGRDGYRYWMGTVAPEEAHGKQIDGGGWGNRFKVRIMGYHPPDLVELPDKDLPWSQVLLPTTAGSGGVMSSSTRGVVAMAWSPNVPSYSAVMDYITYSSSGGVSGFGDLRTARGSLNTSVASNNTRGLVGGGRVSSGA